MSVTLMSAVFATGLPAQRKLILLALADNANDAGFCWPSQETIGRKASISTRNLRIHVQALVAEEWMAIVTQGNGRGNSTQYLLNVAKINAAKADAEVVKADLGDTKADDRIRLTISSEPSLLEPSSSKDEDPITEDFRTKMAIKNPLIPNIQAEINRAMGHPNYAIRKNKRLFVENWLDRQSRDLEWKAKNQPQRKGVSRGPASRDPEAFLDPETLKRSNVRVFTD